MTLRAAYTGTHTRAHTHARSAGSSGLRVQLDIQAGLNRQLMQRKEEVEWQLMAAMAKLDEGGGHAPVPLNLLVSGMLQV